MMIEVLYVVNVDPSPLCPPDIIHVINIPNLKRMWKLAWGGHFFARQPSIAMSRSQSAGQQLSVNDLPVVMEELNNAHAKWYDIGLQLCVSVGTLDAIKEQYDDPSHSLRDTLTTWLKTCPSLPTWKNIVDALRSSTVVVKSCGCQHVMMVLAVHDGGWQQH